MGCFFKVPLKKTSAFKVPEEFQKKLDENAALKKAFAALTPGRQRGYLLYFSGAKQHLRPGGKLLLGTGDTADLRMIHSLAKQNGYQHPKILRQASLPLEQHQENINEITYFVYEFSPISI